MDHPTREGGKEGLFRLDPLTLSQYDLKTGGVAPKRSKPRRVSPLVHPSSRGISGAETSGEERGGLQARLKPLFSSASAPSLRREKTAEPISSETPKNGFETLEKGVEMECMSPRESAGDEQDLEIARLGIRTGEDAVNYFTSADKASAVKFVHLLPADTGLDFRPYTLEVVPACVAASKGEYYVMSRSGLVRCVLAKGANATEWTSMSEWVRQATFFNMLRSMSFFKTFLPRKTFQFWRSNVRRQLYLRQRNKLERRLFLARASFCAPVVELKREIWTLTMAPLVAPPKVRVQSDPLETFVRAQAAVRKEAANALEVGMRSVVDACARACDAVQHLDRARVQAEDPRKRLEALMAAKLASKSAKTQSMNAAVEEKRAERRLARRASEDRALLSHFVRFADCMMVEAVVEHVLHALVGVLLADFTDPAHKIGLFEVAVGFEEDGSLVFTPSLDEFCQSMAQLSDDILALVSRVPRVLDARGCAEYCTSAQSASKFDALIRSLPRFKDFRAAVATKFADDFAASAQHNAANYEIVRPIYEAMLAFQSGDPDGPGAIPGGDVAETGVSRGAVVVAPSTSGDKAEALLSKYKQGSRKALVASRPTYAEARAELDTLASWGKDLEKLRTRDSVGTVEVTSRQLKQTLSQFLDAKGDVLKAVIRDQARDTCAAAVSALKFKVKTLEKEPATLDEYAQYVSETKDYDERALRKLRAPVDQMYALLISNDVKIPSDDLVALDDMKTLATRYSEQLAASIRRKEAALPAYSEKLDTDLVALTSKVGGLISSLDSGVFVDTARFDAMPDERPHLEVVEALHETRAELDEASRRAGVFAGYKELFGLAPDELPILKKAYDRLALVEKLWTCVATWRTQYKTWFDGSVLALNADQLEKTVQASAADAFGLQKKLQHSGVATALVQAVDQFKPLLPLVLDLANPALLPRHWDQICGLVRKSYDPDRRLCFAGLLEWGIREKAEQVADVSSAASGEASLGKTLAKMEAAWDRLAFSTKPWRSGYHILIGVDEIQQELDDQIVRTQAMRGSRFVKPYLERVSDWESMLTTLQDVLDNWLKMQGAWIYLESIFASEDIMRQIPAEGRMFKAVNTVWKESMADCIADPSIVATARRAGLLDALRDANEKLDKIQAGLNSYLETKRLAFPRFFFLSNDELLSILAETRDPTLVQPHLKKCFDGISNLEFTDRLDILAAFDGPVGKSERLEFAYEACKHKKINPKDSGGNVERWLVQVEAIMKKSLAHAIDQALVDASVSSRDDWLRNWQGQTVLTVNQMTWVGFVEAAVSKGGDALRHLHKVRCDELLDVVKAVRGDIPKSLRKTLGSLIVMDVHNRDVTKELADVGVRATTDFDWQAHLRYYRCELKKGQQSALTGEPGTIDCRMINASILYAYEYIGNCGRLVITPLTDRCYRTLMGAIHLNLGGAPEGPAGTGKTETTKDLGKAIAIQCVVTNCSDGLDFKAMGKFFKGLAASGAWACFDEFNRIQLEVLSVIAQQVLTIQQAKARKAEHFLFEGTDLPLKPTCCPFITMNPGYAGRAELPDNLKVLFRTVAMMVPDYAMIGEILLYSMGYTDAKALAVKIVTTYKLCSEQLSSQSHYDYGMRAVMAVLRAAGNLKRAEGHLPEPVLVLRSIIDVNLPKFLSPDVPLFQGITSDLFPGTEIEPPDRSAMYAAFKDACATRRLQPTQYFWEKVVQIYDMMVVRHGFMIVGMPFSGKSSAWKVLADALGLLHERFPDDPRWSKVWPLVMNPKSVTMGQLYGQFDPVSTEWTDGCLAINYRNAAQNKLSGAAETDRKWILLDGPVDAIWIENMNTVLDDNKKLCLMSGEIIAMSDAMSMIFEPMDLLVASPATVSRCGMIYMEPEQLGWQPILDSWLDKFQSTTVSEESEEEEKSAGSMFVLGDGDVKRLRALADRFVEPTLALLRRSLREVSPTVDSALVVSLLNQLACHLEKSIPTSATLDAEQRTRHLDCGFLFALAWSLAVTVEQDDRRRMSTFLKDFSKDVSILEQPDFAGVKTLLALRRWQAPADELTLSLPFPEEGEIHDWCYDPSRAAWTSWLETLPTLEIGAGDDVAQVLVPTVCTAQISYALQLMIPAGISPLIVGPTGTGKSVCIAKALSSELPQDKFKTVSLSFSAKTSANMTQNIIDGQLTKRRKGVFGPPPGQAAVVFVDDVNMPEVETYGAQPPIELLRQMVDNGGYYTLGDKSWQSVVDCVLVGAMGPPGGGRNPTTPRFLRHFSLICVEDFGDATLSRIFSTIVDHTFSSMANDEVKALAGPVVSATLETYREAMKSLLPTPSKSHYVFNLRDFARVILGVLMADDALITEKETLARLWCHEALRVFADRLTDTNDRDWFAGFAKKTVESNFDVKFDEVMAHLKAEDTDVVGYAELRNLFFGNLMTPQDEEHRPYCEIKDVSALQQTVEQYLMDFNAVSKKPMDLVMFLYAVEHVSRISRILTMPGGNALLVGVGGSGRQSLAILAADIAGCALKRIEISKNYGQTEWRDDMKLVLRDAGVGEKPVVFVFGDVQIAFESMVEDLNNVLNSGMIPNLFANDEKVSINEQVRPLAKERYGKDVAANMTPIQLFTYFVQRVKDRLHIVLAFSPIGDAFRERLRLFPSLINCCVIDWFTAWPGDALVAVADKFLAKVELDEHVRPAVTNTCQLFHESVAALSLQFHAKTGRITYVTPTSYLELIVAFKESLAKQRDAVEGQKRRYENGLEQIASAERNVETMQQELTELQPVLRQSQKDTDALMAEIEAKLPGVREQEEIVGKEAKVCQEEADKVKLQVDEVQADLDEAIPALNEALKALDTIKPNDINEVKALAKPPATVKLVCEAVCVMLGEKPVRANDPDDPSKKIMDYWPTSQKMLADKNFIQRMKSYDKDNIPAATIKAIRSKYVPQENFNPEAAAKASSAAAGLCKWCFAMNTYDRVAKIVAPKKASLAQAQESLAVTMSALEEKKKSLKEVQDDLAALQAKLESSKKKKADLSAQVDLCAAKLERAKQLLNDLGGEKTRWRSFVAELSEALVYLAGDVLLAAGQMAYLGPYTSDYRDDQTKKWHAHCKKVKIPVADACPTLSSTLGDPTTIQQWHVDGLPTDSFSIDNAITVFNSRRWPLMIDPQNQASKWIKTMESPNGLVTTKQNEDFVRVLENGVQFGRPVLLEGVGETLESALEPLLLKQLFVSGGQLSIDLGGNVVPYDEKFRFYMCTKLPNPHYLPEVSVKVLLTNFSATPAGLADQLLGVIVAEERADLQKKRDALIVDRATNARRLKDIEDSILKILSSSASILEDESAIQTLGKSKVTSDEIKAKQEVASKTANEIDAVRAEYRPAAFSTQVLFFCIADLQNIEPTYSYSLSWFIALFISSIQRSEPADDVPSRLANLETHFKYSLYCNVCRSLLEKDRLLFSFLLCSRTLKVDKNEWMFLLTGGVSLDNPHPNPGWLPERAWNEVCLLSELDSFRGLRDSFSKNKSSSKESWKGVFDSTAPHLEAFPEPWNSECTGLKRLCVLRALRFDKVVLAVQKFVVETMGDEFVRPPIFDLGASFEDSSSTTPLVFVLSPGSDPMGAIMQLAESKKVNVTAISLGQGQGPVADRIVGTSRKDGSWVVLQNCHLAPSYMPKLEIVCEGFKPDTVHKDFRLWCTTYPSPVFPVSILQNSVKMTIEPPKGLRANLIGSFSNAPLTDEGYFDSIDADSDDGKKTRSFRKLNYALCVFHALLQERRLYGPLGWNIPYGFNESDLHISLRQLKLFLEENDEVPFKALKYCIGQTNFGGRVTDGKDRRTLTCILDRFFRPEVLEVGTSLSESGTYSIPSASTREEFLGVIQELPLTANPELFGLHENASITKSSKEVAELFGAVLLTEGGSNTNGSNDAEETMKSTAEDVLGKLPDEFDLEAAKIKYPVRRDESMNTVLLQELVKFNTLVSLIRTSLKDLVKAVKGEVVMSDSLEKLGRSLVVGSIPAMWKTKSYPSFKPLSGYVNDLLARLAFFQQWVDAKPPSTFWISSFFFQHAFLTASKQNFARAGVIPIDNIGFRFEMLKASSSNPSQAIVDKPPKKGFYGYGLFFEGARWDPAAAKLAESHPKILFSPAPLMWFEPMRVAEIHHPPSYNCPVYKTADRRGVLATTGHSTNFIMDILVPSDVPESHWVQRGVAMLSQLDD